MFKKSEYVSEGFPPKHIGAALRDSWVIRIYKSFYFEVPGC
jgi:hypothetical protein